MTNSFLWNHKLLFTLVILYMKPVSNGVCWDYGVQEQRDDKCYLEELDAECENIPQKQKIIWLEYYRSASRYKQMKLEQCLFIFYHSRGFSLPRAKSIFTLVTAISSSFRVRLVCFYYIKTVMSTLNAFLLFSQMYRLQTWEQTISWAVTALKCSIFSLGTAYSLQNCK